MPYRKTIQEIEQLLKTDIKAGLSSVEVESRKEKFGTNILKEETSTTFFDLLWEQLSDPLIVILFISAFISVLLQEYIDACVIISVVLLNSFIGISQQNKAEKALQALKQLSNPKTIVYRNHHTYEIDASDVVLGDIVLLTTGSYVPADIRLIESKDLYIEESALTGESLAVEKDATWISKDSLIIAERKNMAYMSTYVTAGKATGIVVAIGMDTQIGQIANLLQRESEMTPLQKRLAHLSKWLGLFVIVLCIILLILSVIQGKAFFDMLLTAISLAVAVVPEGLPAVVTISLALGVKRMSQSKAIIRQLPAVETLGSVSVICSDKTGTLTQNKMTVIKTVLDLSGQLNRVSKDTKDLFYEGLLLCNDSKIEEERSVGTATEIAIAQEAILQGYSQKDILKKYPRIDEIPFSSERKRMITVHPYGTKQIIYMKGAIEVILPFCQSYRYHDKTEILTSVKKQEILQQAEMDAKKALRIIALAYRIVDHATYPMEDKMIFLGYVGLIDPPRPEVKDAIETAHRAHIKVVMITGDHPDTAGAIARQLNITEDPKTILTGTQLNKMSIEQLSQQIDCYRVFARVTPEHKVKIVEAFQKRGHITAMTGDGVNDAPALKKAEIGIAMGSGTDVSKQASDMILVDDNFSTIIYAVEEGRNIYLNIQKAILYLLSCNLGEMFVLFLAVLLMNRNVLPLNAIQILWINLMTDAFPALALSKEPHDPYIMIKKPHSSDRIFMKGNIAFMILNGLYIGTISLVSFRYGLQFHEGIASTMCFMVLSLSQLFHSLNFRSIDHSIFKVGIFKNRYLIFVFSVAVMIQISTTLFPLSCELLGICGLSVHQWSVVFLLSSSIILINEISKIFNR